MKTIITMTKCPLNIVYDLSSYFGDTMGRVSNVTTHTPISYLDNTSLKGLKNHLEQVRTHENERTFVAKGMIYLSEKIGFTEDPIKILESVNSSPEDHSLLLGLLAEIETDL